MPPRHHEQQTGIQQADALLTVSAGPLPPCAHPECPRTHLGQGELDLQDRQVVAVAGGAIFAISVGLIVPAFLLLLAATIEGGCCLGRWTNREAYERSSSVFTTLMEAFLGLLGFSFAHTNVRALLEGYCQLSRLKRLRAHGDRGRLLWDRQAVPV